MILGTYWYFHFPTSLYEFDYFEFKNSHGGHADNPAELITNIKAWRKLIDFWEKDD
jgi:hypothetical protein